MSGVSVSEQFGEPALAAELEDFVSYDFALSTPGRYVVIWFKRDDEDGDQGVALIDEWENPEDGELQIKQIADEERTTFDGAFARARDFARMVGADGIVVKMIEDMN